MGPGGMRTLLGPSPVLLAPSLWGDLPGAHTAAAAGGLSSGCHLHSLIQSLSCFLAEKPRTFYLHTVRILEGDKAQGWFHIWGFCLMKLSHITKEHMVSLLHLFQAELRSGLALGGQTTLGLLPSLL